MKHISEVARESKDPTIQELYEALKTECSWCARPLTSDDYKLTGVFQGMHAKCFDIFDRERNDKEIDKYQDFNKYPWEK